MACSVDAWKPGLSFIAGKIYRSYRGILADFLIDNGITKLIINIVKIKFF